MPEWLILQDAGVNRYYDHLGREIDPRNGKPFLRKPDPEKLEKLAKMKKDIAERARLQVHKTREEREEQKHVGDLKEKIDSLRENIHHLRCQQEFYRQLLSPVFSQWLADLDANITEAMRYRNHLINKQIVAEEMIGELADVMLSQDHEITKLQDEIQEIQNKKKEPSVTKETVNAKKARVIKALGEDKIAELAKLGVTIDQIMASLG